MPDAPTSGGPTLVILCGQKKIHGGRSFRVLPEIPDRFFDLLKLAEQGIGRDEEDDGQYDYDLYERLDLGIDNACRSARNHNLVGAGTTETAPLEELFDNLRGIEALLNSERLHFNDSQRYIRNEIWPSGAPQGVTRALGMLRRGIDIVWLMFGLEGVCEGERYGILRDRGADRSFEQDAAAEAVGDSLKKPIASSVANSQLQLRAATPPRIKELPPPTLELAEIQLNGAGEKATINGELTDEALNDSQCNVVEALLSRRPRGLSKDKLVSVSGHTDAVQVLKRLFKKRLWCDVILLPGKSGLGYRIK
jgi:hypothetical protein